MPDAYMEPVQLLEASKDTSAKMYLRHYYTVVRILPAEHEDGSSVGVNKLREGAKKKKGPSRPSFLSFP